MEGDRKNPRNPEDRVFEEVIDELSKDTILDIVEEEIRKHKSYFDTLVWDNNSICNKCFEEEYSFFGERPFINCFNGDIETVVERLIHLRPVDFYKFPNVKDFGECKYCSYVKEDFRRPHKTHREGMGDIQKLESMLEDSSINYDIDLLYTTFKYLHKGRNDYEDYECLRRCFQYSLDYSKYQE